MFCLFISFPYKNRYDVNTRVEHVYVTLGRKSFLSYESLSYLITTDAKTRSLFSEQLKTQLKSKRMIYTKDQLHLSTTVGQGKLLEDSKIEAISCVYKMTDLYIISSESLTLLSTK